MAATLTDRYIDAVTRSLAPDTQDDVRTELTASIADAVDARLEQGEALEIAEREVLTELGDPAVLAAGYADRPLHLIGPQYFLTWWRLLKLLLWIVPVTAAAGVTIANVLADKPVGEIIGQVFVVGIATIVHTAFWTTLVFFILERTGADTGVRWTLDSLPEPQQTGAGRADLIASLVFLGIAAGAMLWDRFVGFVFVAEGGIDISEGLGGQTTALPMLNPDLWPWWLAIAFALIGAEGALAIAVYGNRGWNRALATLNTALAAVFAAGVLYLLVAGQLLNPEFLDFVVRAGGEGLAAGDAGAAAQGGVLRILAVLLGAAVVGVAVWDSIDGWRKARR